MKKYAVIKFLDDKSCEVIPSVWLNSDQSIVYWPRFKTDKQYEMLLEEAAEPNKLKWKRYSVQVMKTSGMLK